jgi:uncharacterized protein
VLPEHLIKPFLRFNGQTLSVIHLKETDPFWLKTAEELIALFQEHIGQTQTAWERRLERYLGSRLDYLRGRGLARVLAPPAAFVPLEVPCPPLELRRKLFPHGPVFSDPDLFHPHTRQDLLQEISADVGLPAEQVNAAMFADRPEEHVLKSDGPSWTPERLLARYNLELARGALYRATDLQIEIHDNFKEVFRYLKLFKIMYSATAMPAGGYRVNLFGPLSDFVDTDRYGFSFAEFMPALLLGERWSLLAETGDPSEKRARRRKKTATSTPSQQAKAPRRYYYRLNHTCGLHSYYKRGPIYDSQLERAFAEEVTEFEEKFGEARGRWRLKRESQIIVLESTVDERRKILIEIVGFWEPGYLKRKVEKARSVNSPLLLFLVYEDLNVSKDAFDGLESSTILFKHKPLIKDVMPVVESMAERAYGPLPTRGRGRRTTAYMPLEQLVQAYYWRAAQREQQEWLLLGQLEEVLKQLDPGFSPRHYGFTTLSALVQGNAALFATRRRSVKGRPLEVSLLQTEGVTQSI